MRKNQKQRNLASQIPTFSRSLVRRAASQPRVSTAANSSQKTRIFLTEIANLPQSLIPETPKTILLSELATALDVSPKRLIPLIENGYLKVVSANPPAVLEPPPGAVNWLKFMFMPLPMRPFLSTEMVAEIEDMHLTSIRNLCLNHDIPLYLDPVFGELMSINSFHRLHRQIFQNLEPTRFDRQAMLVALMRVVDPENYADFLEQPEYSVHLEKEINRISKMLDPMRTESALRLWAAYSSAKSVSDCLAAARGKEAGRLKHMWRVENMVTVKTETAPDEGTESGE